MNNRVILILNYLNKHQIRATYTAVQDYLGFSVPTSEDWDRILGPHSQDTSWVVNEETGLPFKHAKRELHPQLQSKSKILTDARQLGVLLEETRGLGLNHNSAIACPSCGRAFVPFDIPTEGVRHRLRCDIEAFPNKCRSGLGADTPESEL
jgi:hypothetical protein